MGGKGAAGVKFTVWSLVVVGRKGMGYSFMELDTLLCDLSYLGNWESGEDKMETLGISLLNGNDVRLPPSVFCPRKLLNLVLVPEEGPSAVTKGGSVRRRCQVPLPHGRASPGGAEPAPRGRREGWLCRTPSSTFLIV